jgi:predicted RNA binding protein YcfA (HicA-like mRNA interferase family)
VKLPRDLTGAELAAALARVGYIPTRQTGSHVRLTLEGEPEHHVTIPAPKPLKVGTLTSILAEVAQRLQIGRDELIHRLKL